MNATTTGEAPVLEVRDLSTRFTTPQGVVRAVDGVSFSLRRGSTLGVVGEYGSGKTVLSRSIMRLLPRRNVETSGQVLINGREILGVPHRQMRQIWAAQMAMVFQDPMSTLHPLKRVGEQIVESLHEHRRLSRQVARARAVELLTLLSISEPERRVRQYPHQLSGGMRQRISLAIALACDPDVIFADEPTTALDVTVQAQILDLLGHHQRERRMAMVMISHDLGVVAGRTHDLIVMYGGQVVESGPTTTVLGSPRMPYTTALLDSMPRLDVPPHARIKAITGHPPNPARLPRGCRFAPRCSAAQERCTREVPSLTATEGGDRAYRCFYPTGTEAGDRALRSNREVGQTATGLVVGPGRREAV